MIFTNRYIFSRRREGEYYSGAWVNQSFISHKSKQKRSLHKELSKRQVDGGNEWNEE